jgi:RND family efflux transporter MFP subunit
VITEPTPEPTTPAAPRGRRRAGALVAVAVAALVLGLGIYSGVRARSQADVTLKQATDEAAVITVNVVNPKPGDAVRDIQLPGITQAFIDAPIFARTSGYLKRWYFDIGAQVKQGQLLAEIDSPEVDQQLQQARADLETAQANLRQAKITADRWEALLESGSVSTQETDVAVSALSAMKATADSNAANVRRLEQLQGFEKVYAPFDGVVTARNTDIGALIDAGSATAARELFHMAAIHRLRVFVAVPEVYSRAAVTGASASLTLDEYPGREFHGTLVRNSSAIDPASRTLLIEVDVDNPKGELLPGAYVFVHLKLPRQSPSVTVPANTLLFRAQGLQVGVVRNSQAQLVSVTIRHDYGTTVEIVAGIEPGDQVILSPSDSLSSGTPVRVATPPPTAAPAPAASPPPVKAGR